MKINDISNNGYRRPRTPCLSTPLLAIMAAVLVLWANGTTIRADQQDGAIAALAISSTAPGTMSLQWDAASPAPDDYRVSWAKSDESFKAWSDANWNAYPTGSSHSISGLEGGTEYKARVRARYLNEEGNVERNGPWSSTVSITVMSEAEPLPTP